jgi:hypothetical protein
MAAPENSIPMLGGRGKHDTITMGEMLAVLKIRDAIISYADPGWYDNPRRTLADPATLDVLQRNGITVRGNRG